LTLSWANVAAGQNAEHPSEAGGYQLEAGQGPESSEYQLEGPGQVTSPDELLRQLSSTPATDDEEAEGDDGEETGAEDDEEPSEAESTVSLELDVEEEAPLTEEAAVRPQEAPVTERLRWFTIPPYYQGRRGDSGVRLFFPIFFQSWRGDGRKELAILPFYWRSRGPLPGQGGDVVFPFVWSFRHPERRTLILGNVYHSRGTDSSAGGVAPLAFWGRSPTLSYQVVPPLFFRFAWTDGRGFTLAGLYFNHRQAGDRYRRGVFPLYWSGQRYGRKYHLGLPLVYHFEELATGNTTTVVPPLYVQSFNDGFGFGLAPLFFMTKRQQLSRYTLFPLFHYGQNSDGDRTFVSPLAWYRRQGDRRMGGALLYHWSRSPTSRFDGFIPLYMRGTDETRGSRWQFIAPLLYTSRDPVRRRTVVFPVVWDFHLRHQSRTTAVLPFFVHRRHQDRNQHSTWVFPTFQYSRTPDSTAFNIHPLLYVSQKDDRSHQVFAPLFWRFHRPGSTRTVAFPLYWDFQQGDNRTLGLFPFFWQGRTADGRWTAVLNVVHRSGTRQGVPYWSFNLFPLFRVGRPAPGDIDWQFLLGLAGYGRRGSRRWVDLFWVPVELSPSSQGSAVAQLPSIASDPAVPHTENSGTALHGRQ
jgi:hypothetical protein